MTDGNYLWVVDDSSTDKVFKYTVAGTFVGSWRISTSGPKNPTGITLDPSNPAHIWIVDSGTDRVYQYDNSVGLTSGSKSANSSWALAAGNTNPQGIVDPPPPSGGLNTTPGSAVSNSATSIRFLQAPIVLLAESSTERFASLQSELAITTQLNVFRSWEFEFLVVILFGEHGDIRKALEVPVDVAQKYAKRNEHQGGWIKTTNRQFLIDHRATDITTAISIPNSPVG